jgi:hypothetical protein
LVWSKKELNPYVKFQNPGTTQAEEEEEREENPMIIVDT